MRAPPQALALAEELSEQLVRRSSWTTTMVTGDPGTGKTAVLGALTAQIDQAGLPWMRLSPTSGDLDGPANALAQGAASMREKGVNGVLDAVFDPTASFDHKLDAFGRGMRSLQDDVVILLDMPDSWARPSHLEPNGGAFAFWGHRIAQEVLHQGRRRRVVLAASHALDAADIHERVLRRGGGGASLSGSDWGAFAADADSMSRLLPDLQLDKLTPLELRVAVALRALGVDDRRVEDACRGRWPELRRVLQLQVRSLGWLQEAFFVLSHTRVAVGRTLLDQLLATCAGADEDRTRPVLTSILLMGAGDRFVFHPRLQRIDTHIEADRRRALGLLTNRTLATAWDAIAERQSWRGVVAWWESLHHWAEADEEAKLEDVPDTSMWTTLGRRRSLLGDYESAVRAFRRALALQPDDSYAHEYLAYNLDRCDQDLRCAEASFRRAVELAPQNPWWNRRLVEALQRRGKIDEARRAWLAALDQIDEAAEPSDWMQRNLHLGVCRGFLDRGQHELAAAVLETVSRESWIPDFGALWNTICHRREAAELEAAVFPESVDFEQRWQGPRLGGESTPTGWFPGRVVGVDGADGADGVEVELELAVPPVDDAAPELFGLTLGRAEFLTQAELPRSYEPRPGLFLEVHVDGAGKQRIYIDREQSFPSRPPSDWDLLDEFRK